MMRAMLAVGLALGSVAAAAGQELSKPTKEHEWMKQFLGEWEVESEAVMEPGQPPVKGKGAMTGRMLGEFWMIADVKGETGVFTVAAVFTLGYDGDKKKYVGTWVDSAMNHLWKYTGTVDDAGKKITLEAEGPDFSTPGKTAKYHDAYEFKSKDHIVLTSAVLGADGKWTTFMTSQIRRKK